MSARQLCEIEMRGVWKMNSETLEHYPWCAGAQNMARPRSQRLIGPKCECRQHREAIEKSKVSFDAWLETEAGNGWLAQFPAFERDQANERCAHGVALNCKDCRIERLEDSEEMAWGIIANAYGGDWTLANKEWREATIRWRDKYFAALEQANEQ